MAAEQLSLLLNQTSARAPSPSTCTQILSLLRESRLPRPDLVLRFGDVVLTRLSKNGKQYWDVAAQICSAAADLGEFEIMTSLSNQIYHRFQQSIRTFVILGCAKEANSLWKPAMDNYISVIKEQPMAPAVYKRQVAVLKSEIKIPEAVSMLNYYLSFYSDDVDAWAELCALCLSLGRFSHALFAANELIINDPGNHAYQTLTADVYMTSKGKDNIIRAREHYSVSLMAKKHGNLRALYGLWLSCSVLTSSELLDTAEDVAHNDKLRVTAEAGIASIYDRLSKEMDSSPTGAAALKMISSDVVTGNLKSRKRE